MTQSDPERETASGKTVLIVDDQPDERAIQQAMLRHRGYGVKEAADGRTGLDMALTERPDLILLDVAMPGMDGFEVCRALRQDDRTREVPILLFTASVVGELADRARAAGATGVLEKPVDPHEVAGEIERLIGRP